MRTLLIIVIVTFSLNTVCQNKKPNVILVLTDDQGIGDLGCHGNPWIKTSNIESFYKESVRLTDFHVSPFCTPTRGAIMTGRYPINNGAWATYKGRDALTEGASTLADLFQENGYKTAMFGKWHLGDNYPVRPTDCGFDVAIQHKSGGVGELSDYWGNNYFNDVYYVNNKPKKFEGYCTDVWFDEAMKFIDINKNEPFFVYLSTNGPLYVADKYSDPYKKLTKEKKIVSAEFYGMITNLDENFGKLEKFLKKKKIVDNTILIFMTDNGSSYGISKDGKIGYNKGLRGSKGYKTEGGHRVPFFIRWKDGEIKGGRDVHESATHIDILPTLASLCNITIPKDSKLDGLDYSSLLLNKKGSLKDRTIFVHHRQDWRLVNGNELYDVVKDRLQRNNLANQYPNIVKQLLNDNSKFLKKSKTNPEYSEVPVYIVGNNIQPEIKLTIQHALGEGKGMWKSEQVAVGMKNTNNTHSIKIKKDGTYLISCRRWPKECSGPILGIPLKNPKNWFTYKTISPEKVRISIANQIIEKSIGKEDEEVVFEVKLKKGKTFLVNDFIEGKKKYGVYYTYIKLSENN